MKQVRVGVNITVHDIESRSKHEVNRILNAVRRLEIYGYINKDNKVQLKLFKDLVPDHKHTEFRELRPDHKEIICEVINETLESGHGLITGDTQSYPLKDGLGTTEYKVVDVSETKISIPKGQT